MTNDEKLTTIVIYGASGDLTWRKLVPALYNNQVKGRMQGCGEIVGFARRPYTDETFRSRLLEGVKTFSPGSLDQVKWDEFSQKLV
jgi:glucose-6-phosphate 1-dehydrogenase